jgi:DNA polymerase elongation subunit (family B)
VIQELAVNNEELLEAIKTGDVSAEDILQEEGPKSSLARGDPSYEGAVVLPPKTGFYYKHPVLCMDFNSLYPSIMLCYWICLLTKVYESQLESKGVTPDMCNKSPIQGLNKETGCMENVYFVKPEHAYGLIPDTEKVLLGARKDAKKLMAKYAESVWKDGKPCANPERDEILEAVFNGRQLGLKILANSMYGAMGANGLLGDEECAGTVTAFGRKLIGIVKEKLYEKYKTNCVGGDTDSVFVMFDEDSLKPIRTVPEAVAAHKELEEYLNQFFDDPVHIEYEKSMFPMLICGKKRYCGIIWELGSTPKFFSKGMETVRRDSLPYTKQTMEKSMKMFMVPRKMAKVETDSEGNEITAESEESVEEYESKMEERVDEACHYIRSQAKKLIDGDVEMYDLILSKQLSREVYANDKQEHLTVIKNMIERGEDPPKLGERVPYCYVVLPKDPKTRKDRKGYEIVEHPDFAVRSRMKINYAYYLDHKFKDPIVRVMRHVLRDRMIKRIISRMPEHKRRDMEAIKAATTADRLTDETERYLFSIAPKRSRIRRNIQTRYVGLSNKVTVAKPTMKSSPLFRAFQRQTEKQIAIGNADSRRIERDKIKLELDEHYKIDIDQPVYSYQGESVKDIEELAEQRLNQAKQTKNEKLKICRECTNQNKIICTAYTCKDYFPRIEAVSNYQEEKQKLQQHKKYKILKIGYEE